MNYNKHIYNENQYATHVDTYQFLYFFAGPFFLGRVHHKVRSFSLPSALSYFHKLKECDSNIRH